MDIFYIWDLKKCGRSRNYIFLANDKEAFEAIGTNPLAEDIVNLVMLVEGENKLVTENLNRKQI